MPSTKSSASIQQRVGVGTFYHQTTPPDPTMSTKNELRLTDTNAASDSKGRTWGLEGGLFWWLIAGIGGASSFFSSCWSSLTYPRHVFCRRPRAGC